jgi:glycosidase
MPLQKVKESSEKLKGIFIHNQCQRKVTVSHFFSTGKAFFPSLKEIRDFVHRLNLHRDLIEHPDKTATAAEWNAILLIDEIMQNVMIAYQKQVKEDVFTQAVQTLKKIFKQAELDILFQKMVTNFSLEPALITDDETAMKQLILLWLLNENPAFKNYRDVFDDTEFYFETNYLEVFEQIIIFFAEQPVFGVEKLNLIKILRKPAEMFPNSIIGQLEYIRNQWQEILSEDFFLLLTSIDILKEENKFALPGSGPTKEYEFSSVESEPEQFSQDLDWMPKVVMIAKSTYVWLDQLSKKYGSEINRLDQIPDAELNLLHNQGFSTLWLIGVWERSKASKRIKHINGSTDSISSAYSIYDYRIADDLGGESAFRNLKERSWHFGIRLASDMVPNHTGIDSKWIKEHPDWFIQLPYSPYPNYSFHGENLSHDNDIVVQLEDHYYNKSDAAVVFRHYDKRNGSLRYIYHGNDGTSYPWNDTAQLNYLLPQVREAVIRQIIEVAKKTPVIRFDAAMTLAKRHFQRLWFPEPGTGGDIPTRAEFGLTKEAFNSLMPVEFWREVVDRIAVEVPDTLLLAEAFWMMEGYFVRTLGMHRVYNSAFMNMLKDEDNAKYRNSLFNIIEFSVEILKRFVNFMSNPDEDTAIAQFGKHDKYFGVCVLMCTMPGLPMFSHGQIEGFTERYGMEYNRAKWNESPSEELVTRHQKEIFPLLKRRAVFSDAENFLLYDFINEHGNVNDNVFVYSNEKYEQKSLVIYHNKFENTSGWIHFANTIENGHWVKKSLAEAWKILNVENNYVIFQNIITGKWYIRNACEVCEKGLFEKLEAYNYKVYLDMYQKQDTEDKMYQKLAAYLQGGGTEDINGALRKTYLLPILNSFRQIVNEQVFTKLMKLQNVKTREYELYLSDFLHDDILNFYKQVAVLKNFSTDIDAKVISVIADFNMWFGLQPKFQKKFTVTVNQNIIILLWLLLQKLDDTTKETDATSLLTELMITGELKQMFNEFPEIDNWLIVMLTISGSWQNKFSKSDWQKLFAIPIIRSVLQINTFSGIEWYHKESMDELITSMEQINYVHYALSENQDKYDWRRFQRFIKKWKQAHEKAECQLQDFLHLL